MKIKIYIILLAIYYCYPILGQSVDITSDIYKVLSKSCQKEKLNYDEMKIFLSSFSEIYDNNIELGEFRNEGLFSIIDSDNLNLFLSTLKCQYFYLPRVLSDLKYPINDLINLQLCIERLQGLDNRDDLGTLILETLESAKKTKK